MSRVLTFSRTYPSYHPMAGQPTFFVEKIWKGLPPIKRGDKEYDIYSRYPRFMKRAGIYKIPIGWRDQMRDPNFHPKHHTLRAGHHWKEGEWFSPRVWSEKPYASKQIVIGPDIQIKTIWEFDAEGTDFFLNGRHEVTADIGFDFSELEKNDGLPPTALFDWICEEPKYKKSQKFSGQVICWNDKIKY